MDNSAQNSRVADDDYAQQGDAPMQVNDQAQGGQAQGQPHPYQQQPQPQQPQHGSMAKEEEPFGANRQAERTYETTQAPEQAPVVEVGETEIDPEVAEFVQEEKKENLKLGKKVVHQGEVLVEGADQDDLPEVVLPVSKQAMADGMDSKVGQSARWLAEWCLRIIKKFHGRVVYATQEEKK